jgi:hypothetical protein
MANPKLEVVGEEPISIQKPTGFSLDKFKSKRTTNGSVETLLSALPVHSIAQAKDFVRLHPDQENYWSDELCFVNVPIQGMKKDTVHLITEEMVAVLRIPAKRVLRHRLALATKPYDVFFLCQVPSTNLDNPWNVSNLQACELSRTRWLQASSQKEQGKESYLLDFVRDENAFPAPNWPTQLLAALIEVSYMGRLIETEDHAAVARLVGLKPVLK